MPQSLSDTINLIASVVSIIGGMISIGGVAYKWLAKPGAAAPIQGKLSPASQSPRRTSAPPVRRPGAALPAKARARVVSHPVILSFSALGLLAVMTYSIELLITYAQSGGASTGLPPSSLLIGVNAVLIALNLACVVVVTVGMAVTAYRTQSNLWLATGVIALVVSLCTIGIFSAVAFVPGVFYGLSGPRNQDVWGA
jgi:hypothetical protein